MNEETWRSCIAAESTAGAIQIGIRLWKLMEYCIDVTVRKNSKGYYIILPKYSYTTACYELLQDALDVALAFMDNRD